MIDFLYELGQLKRVKRSGWWLAGVKDPESVAEHCFRAAAIGYFLAKEEKVDVHKTVMMCLFNDVHEARINDLHKLGHRYIDFKQAEKAAFTEQMNALPEEFSQELITLMNEFQTQSSKEAIVGRDADLLECAIQAKEYMKIGYEAQDWINNIRRIIMTKSGKMMLDEIEKSNPSNWWQGLKKIDR
jgi:putative hydrolases of HD superfamily